MYLEVCNHEVPLVMSPVMQATGWQIVQIWVWLHLMLTSAYLPKELDEKVAELLFQVVGTEIFFPVVTWISPGVPSAGFTRHKKSELRAPSNGSEVRGAGLTPHKKSTPRPCGMGSFSASPTELIDFRHDVPSSHLTPRRL